jgi:hypothetical protein
MRHLRSFTRAIPLLGLAFIIGFQPATAEPVRPTWAPLEAVDIDAARVTASQTSQGIGTDPRTWEQQLPEPASSPSLFGNRADINWPDSHAAHYARGETMVMHVFVNSTGQTWSQAERSAAGAQAMIAKGFYLDNAPIRAYIDFDEGATGYNYMEVTLPYAVPADGFTWDMIEDALALLGNTDDDGDGFIRDDFSIDLQNYAGGWDNVIACFEPHVTGRCYAGQNTASCILYLGTGGSVFAHEWGHIFGECDEYLENGTCQGGIDCGPCRSVYLTQMVNNGNCELASCPSDVPCMMRNNVFSICDYTLKHWAWWDEDSDGLPDTVNRKAGATSFVPIYQMMSGWTRPSNEVNGGWVFPVFSDHWAVVGMSAPATVDYDISVYGDNNHNYIKATSMLGAGTIDFIAGDYRHNRKGLDHAKVSRHSGDMSNYMIQFREATETLYADGVVRSGSFVTGGIFQVYDLPLFGGEQVPFTLTVTGGNLDLGMSLFRSNGSYYWAGRTAAALTRDTAGPGGTETMVYTVPEDDVYGLVIFSKSGTTGSFTIEVGELSATLTEEVPLRSSDLTKYFNYTPNASSWSVVGVRPDAGTETALTLYDYLAPGGDVEQSNGTGAGRVEIIAADYSGGSDQDFARVDRESGSGGFWTEWEQDDDNLTGVTPLTAWGTSEVAKIWDLDLTAGLTYFVREYHEPATNLDTGIYLFSSADGDRFKNRLAYTAVGDSRLASAGGEWFTVTPSVTDTYGLCQIVSNAAAGDYSIWVGRKKALADRERFAHGDPVLFSSASIATGNWAVFAERTVHGSSAEVALFGDDGYSQSALLATGASSGAVSYVVGDYNHNPAGTAYPRFRRNVGSASMQIQYESGSEALTFQPGQIASADNIFFQDDVVVVYDVFIDGGLTGRDVILRVDDLSGTMDLTLALFKSSNDVYYASQDAAVGASDRGGTGASESFQYNALRGDWYGLVVTKKFGSGNGLFRVSVGDPAVMAAETPLPLHFDLALRSPNPFAQECRFGYVLEAPGPAGLAIYDVQGRLVRSLLGSGSHPAGAGVIEWDGRDNGGRSVAPGVYVASLSANGREKRLKIVRVK